MKKILSTLLCVGLLFTVVACGKEKKDEVKKENSSDTILSCVSKHEDETSKMTQEVEAVYTKDQVVTKIKMTISAAALNDAAKDVTKEEWDKGIDGLKNMLSEGVKDSKNVTINSTDDYDKRSYSVDIIYDISKMSKEELEKLEFSEYISEDKKFDVDKFKEDLAKSEDEYTCTTK